MPSKQIKKLKAMSLAEILIVLGIISTTMVAALSMIIQSMITIKANELEDTANGVMIQGLEIVKSPTVIDIRDSAGNSGNNLVYPTNRSYVYSYSIGKDSQTGQTYLRYEGTIASTISSEIDVAGKNNDCIISAPTGTQAGSQTGTNVNPDGSLLGNNFIYATVNDGKTPICLEVLIKPSEKSSEYLVVSKVLFNSNGEEKFNLIKGKRFLPIK